MQLKVERCRASKAEAMLRIEKWSDAAHLELERCGASRGGVMLRDSRSLAS